MNNEQTQGAPVPGEGAPELPTLEEALGKAINDTLMSPLDVSTAIESNSIRAIDNLQEALAGAMPTSVASVLSTYRRQAVIGSHVLVYVGRFRMMWQSGNLTDALNDIEAAAIGDLIESDAVETPDEIEAKRRVVRWARFARVVARTIEEMHRTREVRLNFVSLRAVEEAATDTFAALIGVTVPKTKRERESTLRALDMTQRELSAFMLQTALTKDETYLTRTVSAAYMDFLSARIARGLQSAQPQSPRFFPTMRMAGQQTGAVGVRHFFDTGFVAVDKNGHVLCLDNTYRDINLIPNA